MFAEKSGKLGASLYLIITLSKRFSKTLICRISGDVSLECILKDVGRMCNTLDGRLTSKMSLPSKKKGSNCGNGFNFGNLTICGLEWAGRLGKSSINWSCSIAMWNHHMVTPGKISNNADRIYRNRSSSFLSLSSMIINDRHGRWNWDGIFDWVFR